MCRDWEAATRPAAQAGIRTVIPRFGVVLSAHGGALGKMLIPFRLGLGGLIGGGQQWISWIGMDDLLGALHHVLFREDVDRACQLCDPKPGAQ